MAKQDIDLNNLKSRLADMKKGKREVYDNNSGELISNLYFNKNDELIRVDNKPCNYQLNIRDNNVELIIYNEPLLIPSHVITNSDLISSQYTIGAVDTALSLRNFELDSSGVAVPKEGREVCLHDFLNSVVRSSKRSIQNFYNYALSNHWEYFCTWTFADKETRLNKDLLFSEWNAFLRRMRRDNKDVKSIAVYERFEDRTSGFHMHSLLSDCDLRLVAARNPHANNNFMYTEFGNQKFNCIDWHEGHNTVVCIDPRSHRSQIVNYMSKYMTKESPAPYGCKRYFHTRNLECSLNYLGFKKRDELDEIIQMFGLTVPAHKKQTNGVSYYVNTIEADDEA